MEIIIHIESKKLDKNLQLAINEYIKRTSPYCRVNIKLYKSFDKLTTKSGSKVFKVIAGDGSPTSEGLCQIIKNLNLSGFSCIEFVIADCSKDTMYPTTFDSFETFSLSSFSMSMDLTTVVLTEQIYRAYTIMNNITYHK